MKHYVSYNITKYVDAITEVTCMVLDGILRDYSKCKRYTLNEDVSDYLKYIDNEPFYVSPTFNDVKTSTKQSTLHPKFVLFSAPGATGKSALAKHIANRFDALYWDLPKVKIGTNSFAGSVLNAVGAARYSEFIGDLNAGKVLLVIDAFDEAEIVSGRKMLNDFLSDISNSLTDYVVPSVFLLARTETAQYIAAFCGENDIPITHYEIGFFSEGAAKDFIVKSITERDAPKKPDIDCADEYYNVIKNNITETECASFLGYAPVLEAISAHIKETPNRQKMISELSTQRDCVSIITKIMDDLLDREQTKKVIPAFKEKCKENSQSFADWDKLYSAKEQLVRVINYVLFQDTKYANYPLEFLPPQLVDDYQAVLDSFICQHPFVRDTAEAPLSRKIDFTGPAFRDYSLARMILDSECEELADVYFEESQSQSYFPSQIFFDCYMRLTNNVIKPNHIAYVYDSFKAKATAYERPLLQCDELPTEDEKDFCCFAVFSMIPGKKQMPRREDYFAEVSPIDAPLKFTQLMNIAINTPSIPVVVGRSGIVGSIVNSSVICKTLSWNTQNITIESYSPEGCLLVAREGFLNAPPMIDINGGEDLKVSAPNINTYYKLLPYKYNFEDPTARDITTFIHALHCILIEFRTHGKDVLAKSAERIDYVTVGNSIIKKQVLDYLKDCNIIYLAGHLYKINETNMQSKGINFNALHLQNSTQLQDVFLDFCKWAQEKDLEQNFVR